MNRRYAYAATERASHQKEEFDFGLSPAVYDVCRKRHRDNPESRAAFESIKDRLTQAQERVLNCIRSAGELGRTNDEICVVLGLTPNQVSPRLTELAIAHRIEKVGTRLTRSKCSAAVWRTK